MKNEYDCLMIDKKNILSKKSIILKHIINER